LEASHADKDVGDRSKLDMGCLRVATQTKGYWAEVGVQDQKGSRWEDNLA
jgi:hypothetical protein